MIVRALRPKCLFTFFDSLFWLIFVASQPSKSLSHVTVYFNTDAHGITYHFDLSE